MCTIQALLLITDLTICICVVIADHMTWYQTRKLNCKGVPQKQPTDIFIMYFLSCITDILGKLQVTLKKRAF